MDKEYNSIIVSKKEIAEGIFDIYVDCAEVSRNAKPGQFIHIDCGDGVNTLLRRPISICDAKDSKVRFLFEVKGSGTKYLANKNEGDIINFLGPLGRGFTVSDSFKKPAVIGGGIGIFPLLMLSKRLNNPSIYLGFRNKDRLVLQQDFKKVADSLYIATDDGSYGYNGFALDLLKNDISEGEIDIIYACGPKSMLAEVKKIAESNKIKCQLSLEQRMGCGIGACLTCVCKTIGNGSAEYKRVCKDGPVFWSDEVILDD